MNCFYHCTNLVQKLPPILSSGHLLPHADGHVETPLVWFSAHPFWEPTATKPFQTDGALVSLKFWQYRDLFGCLRFALPADDSRLMAWREVCQQAGLSRVERRKLETAARKRGGDTKQWFAVPDPIPLADTKLEVLSANGWRAAS